MFTAEDILEEFVSCSRLADRATQEGTEYRYYLRRLQYKKGLWHTWKHRPGFMDKHRLSNRVSYQKNIEYFRSPERKAANAARTRIYAAKRRASARQDKRSGPELSTGQQRKFEC